MSTGVQITMIICVTLVALYYLAANRDDHRDG